MYFMNMLKSQYSKITLSKYLAIHQRLYYGYIILRIQWLSFFLTWYAYQYVHILVCLTTHYMYGFFPLSFTFYSTLLLHFQLSTVVILVLPQMVDALALVQPTTL